MKFPTWLRVIGNTDFRGDCPSETAELVTFFNQIRKTDLGCIALHIRNEGKRSHNQTMRQKVEGLIPGAPDIIIPGNPTFVCELKRQDHTKSRWQKGQVEYLKAAQNNGAFVCVALGYRNLLTAVNIWNNH